jgi:hypothetical protein
MKGLDMKNSKVNRFWAREALILLALLAIAAILFIIARKTVPASFDTQADIDNLFRGIDLGRAALLVLLLYPAQLLVRFVVWAVRSLTKDSEQS